MPFNIDEDMYPAIIIVGLIIIFLIAYQYREGFNPCCSLQSDLDRTQYHNYGLRGDRLRKRCIQDNYIPGNRHVRVNKSGGDMYENAHPPSEYGNDGCNQVSCPQNDGFDKHDTCWDCGVEGGLETEWR